MEEDGVEDGEAEELEGNADVLLGGGDGRVLAPADWLDEVDHVLHGGSSVAAPSAPSRVKVYSVSNINSFHFSHHSSMLRNDSG